MIGKLRSLFTKNAPTDNFKAPTDKGYVICKIVDGNHKPVMWFDAAQNGLGCGMAADPDEAAKLVAMLSGLVVFPRNLGDSMNDPINDN